MKQLTQIFNEHKQMLIEELTQAVKERGNVIKLNAIVGGRDALGFNRKTTIDRVYMNNDMFEGLNEVYIMAHDSYEHIERPLRELSTDTILSICMVIDEMTKGGVDNGR